MAACIWESRLAGCRSQRCFLDGHEPIFPTSSLPSRTFTEFPMAILPSVNTKSMWRETNRRLRIASRDSRTRTCVEPCTFPYVILHYRLGFSPRLCSNCYRCTR